jgi:hypothetical protein
MSSLLQNSKEVNMKQSRPRVNREEEPLSYSELQRIREVIARAERAGMIAVLGDRNHPMAPLFGDAAEQIRPIRLLWVSRCKALEALGEEAECFGASDGDWWLAPVIAFSPGNLTNLGYSGTVIDGFVFPYLRSVIIDSNLPLVAAPGKVAGGGWCGYPALGVGYARTSARAAAVWAASVARAKEEGDDVAEKIRPVRLLRMHHSPERLGDAAQHFTDGGKQPDGDVRLAPVSVFNSNELAAALAAGGELVDGYAFPYPRSIAHYPETPCSLAKLLAHHDYHGWCAYAARGVGYARKRDVAIAVYAASSARAKAEEEENQD